MALIAAIPAGIGLAQLAAGMLKKEPKRPTYTVPGAASEAASIAKREAEADTIPMHDKFVDNINRGASNALYNASRASSNSADIQAAASASQVASNNAYENLAMMAMGYRERARSRHLNALNRLSAYQDRAFQYNKAQPFQDHLRTKAGLISSGLSNIENAGKEFTFEI